MATETAFTEESTSKNVQNVGGLANIHYHDVGQGDPVIFLPSGPSTVPSTAWINYSKVLPALAENFRCIAVDLVNYGLTGTFEYHEPGHHVQARMVLALMDHLGIEKAHIVGNSVGGTTSIVIALNHPERVRKVVIGACHASSGGDPYIIANQPPEVGRVAREFVEEPTLKNMRRYMEVTVHQKALVTDELVQYMYGLYTSHPDHTEVRKRSRQTPHSNMADLPNIKAPLLIIHGRYDRMVPCEVALAIMGHIRNSRAVIFNDCGSWPMFEYPDEYAWQVDNFLRNVSN
jgi:pimeloyl-ACP methyl ester carboxylesterase